MRHNKLYITVNMGVNQSHSAALAGIHRIINRDVTMRVNSHAYAETYISATHSANITQHVNATHTTQPKT